MSAAEDARACEVLGLRPENLIRFAGLTPDEVAALERQVLDDLGFAPNLIEFLAAAPMPEGVETVTYEEARP